MNLFKVHERAIIGFSGLFGDAAKANPVGFSTFLKLAVQGIVAINGVYMKTCVTTNKILTDDFVEFKCPGCSAKISRSLPARQRSLEYACKECGFKGP